MNNLATKLVKLVILNDMSQDLFLLLPQSFCQVEVKGDPGWCRFRGYAPAGMEAVENRARALFIPFLPVGIKLT